MPKYETEVQCKVSDLLGGDHIRMGGVVWRVVNTPLIDLTTDDGYQVLRFQLDGNGIDGPMESWAYHDERAIKVVYDDDVFDMAGKE